MNYIRLLASIAFTLCLLNTTGFSQQAQPDSVSSSSQSGNVFNIEAQIIDPRIELPQVLILDKRKQIPFEEVKVEKSFSSELATKREELKFTPNTSNKVKRIKDIDALLNKNRF